MIKLPRPTHHGSILVLFTLVTLTAALGACTSAPSGSADRPGAAVPDLARALEPLPARGAVALLRTEDGIWRAASGDTTSEGPAQPQDRFAIASITKTFVAAVVLQLVGEGRLSLDDSIDDVLPGALPYGGRITMRELLNHSSGLDDARVPDLSPQKTLQAIAEIPLQPRPGAAHSYANINYVVLGIIIEEVTGHSLGQVLSDRIFAPLGLDHTSYGTATARSLEDARWLGYPDVPSGDLAAAGGIVSTVDDVATFFRALLGGEVIGPDLLEDMTRTIEGGEGYRAGLGIFEMELSCGAAWGHGGEWPTYSSIAIAARDGSTVVVVAQNSSGWTQALDVAEEIFCL